MKFFGFIDVFSTVSKKKHPVKNCNKTLAGTLGRFFIKFLRHKAKYSMCMLKIKQTCVIAISCIKLKKKTGRRIWPLPFLYNLEFRDKQSINSCLYPFLPPCHFQLKFLVCRCTIYACLKRNTLRSEVTEIFHPWLLYIAFCRPIRSKKPPTSSKSYQGKLESRYPQSIFLLQLLMDHCLQTGVKARSSNHDTRKTF